jgi:precorrin-8X/cobalt-precorrin-8 methylmutase
MPHTITDGADLPPVQTIRREADLERFTLEEEIVAARMIHAAGW